MDDVQMAIFLAAGSVGAIISGIRLGMALVKPASNQDKIPAKLKDTVTLGLLLLLAFGIVGLIEAIAPLLA